jgi:MFS family permease
MNVKELRILVGGGAANCVANGTWWLQPILMHQFISRQGLSDTAAGLVLTAEVTALAVASALATRWLHRAGSLARLAAVGTLLFLVATVLTLQLHPGYGGLVLLRALAGLGAGLALTVGNRLGAMAADPDAMFAKFGFVNVLFGVVLLWALQPLAALAGDATSFLLLLLAALAMLPLLGAIPAPPAAEATATQQAAEVAPGALRRIGLIAAATFAVGLCSGVMWAYYAVIGEQAGLDNAAVESAISAAIFAAGVATVLASAIGGRFGRAAPIAVGLAVMAGAVLVLSHHPNATGFRIATCFNMAMIYFLLPYFLGAGSAEDGGKGAAYVGSAFFLSGAASPVVGGLLVESAGIGIVGSGVAAVAVVVALLFVYLERRGAAAALAPLAPH